MRLRTWPARERPSPCKTEGESSKCPPSSPLEFENSPLEAGKYGRVFRCASNRKIYANYADIPADSNWNKLPVKQAAGSHSLRPQYYRLRKCTCQKPPIL